MTTGLDFEAPDLHTRLDELGPEGYDRAPFGVIGLDGDATCVAYNSTEAEFAGLDPDRVIGKSFFEQVAPCMNNFLVADKFRSAGPIDEIVPYTLSVKLAPTPCRLRILVGNSDGPNYLVIDVS